ARSTGDGEFHFSNLDAELVRLWEARSRTIQDVAAMNMQLPVGAGRGGARDTAPVVARVTPSFLTMLRVGPLLGRGFVPEDARHGAPAVALLGEGFWRSRYGGAPGVIGGAITVGGLSHTIVGVLPRDVTVPRQSNTAQSKHPL